MVSGQNELMNPSLFLIVDCVCKVSGRLAIHAILKVSHWPDVVVVFNMRYFYEMESC